VSTSREAVRTFWDGQERNGDESVAVSPTHLVLDVRETRIDGIELGVASADRNRCLVETEHDARQHTASGARKLRNLNLQLGQNGVDIIPDQLTNSFHAHSPDMMSEYWRCHALGWSGSGTNSCLAA
jgi:hypothetical protein